MLTTHNIKQPVVLIGGATATGKSRLALSLASTLDAVIVNADSMQLFQELPVLTAQPTPAEQSQAPHRLYGFLSGNMPTSVAFWLSKAHQVIDEVHAQGRTPILVGGTGLYFEALQHGLSAIPPVPAAIKDALKKRLAEQGLQRLYEELEQVDSVSAGRIKPEDTQRIIRALSVFQSTGVPLSNWHGRAHIRLPDYSYFSIWLDPLRHVIVERLSQRCQKMFVGGAVDEVRSLLNKAYDPTMTIHKAIGVSQIRLYIEGKMSLEAALEATMIASRQYAKRQQTWFRHRFKADLVLADIPRDIEKMANTVLENCKSLKKFSAIPKDPIDELS